MSKHVVIVGGTSGIGEATAKAFVARGFEVTIGGRDRARLDEAVKRTGAKGRSIDGTSADSANAFFAEVGAFDHLVIALSGGAGGGPFKALSIDALRTGVEAKLFAHITTLQAALPTLRESVTFISAASARAAMPGTAGLAAVNGAIEAMVRPLAAELSPLRVNAVSPGVIDTPWWNAVPKQFKDDVFKSASASLPVRRIGRPEDVASAIVMVAENGFMTGTVLEVDGGAHLAR
jgi:NAD(P)-dependent dehydrogenase (short-subunit alcohol dehydrogenase family)